MVRSEVSRSAPDLRVVVATASGKASEIWVAPAVSEYVVRGAVVTDSSWKSWTSGVAALAAARRADNSTSAPDAATKPADAAAADAIDAVRAVADVSVHAVVDAGPTPHLPRGRRPPRWLWDGCPGGRKLVSRKIRLNAR